MTKGPGHREFPIEATLALGDEKLKWYSVEELFKLGLTRGQIDRLVLTRAIRWSQGQQLFDFLNSLGLVADRLELSNIYYQVGDQFFIDSTPEGAAARASLDAMGVAYGKRCQVCGRMFPEQLLLPDRYQKFHCAECANAS